MRIAFLDFEFNQITEEKVNLVCASSLDGTTNKVTNFWLHNDSEEKKNLYKFLKKYDRIVCFAAIAEARSYYSLGLNPLSFEWIDLYLEYKCLSNHNDKLNFGKQLVNGKVGHYIKPVPKWERDEDDEEEEGGKSFKQTHSLAEATYKLTGQIRDTEHKTKMRNLIISNPPEFTAEEKFAIMNYCSEDVEHLPQIFERIIENFKELLGGDFDEKLLESDMLTRGRFAAHTAIMESKGYPIDVEKTRNFSSQVANILYDCQREINQLFPEIKPFTWDKKNGRFKWNQKSTREWIEKHPNSDKWEMTDGGKDGLNPEFSLSLEAFTTFYDFKHDYPKDNFGAQMVRYLKLKQSLYGFVPTLNKNKKSFWDSVGSDGRVRPYTNIYGAQSSRSQPSSTGFMFLKPAWMRSLVTPKPGMAMGGIDYGSQEFFISALKSGDDNMVQSYLSGDVYLAFAKLANIIPPHGTKAEFKLERDMCKSTVLGISFLMTKYGLAIKLSSDSGEEWTEEEAQNMIDIFYESYPQLKEYQEGIILEYEHKGYLRLPDGWYLWGDNTKFRSVSNVPIQGFGACVMRKAVELAFERGLYVPFTLHDALYIEFPVGQEHQMLVLRECMRDAFANYFWREEDKADPDNKASEIAKKINMDMFMWSPDYKKDSEIVVNGVEIACSDIYRDERALSEYEQFSKYFEKGSLDLL